MSQPKTTAVVRTRIAVTGSVVVAAGMLLAGCATSNTKTALLSGAEPVERVVGPHDKVTPGGGRYQVGRPYTIGGKTYYPHEDRNLDQSGVASWYGGDYHHGTKTANGEVFDRGAISAAHKTMPLPSYARVTNLTNGRSLVVRVNDRGPYVGSRIVDLSEKAADLLEMKRHGLGKVRIQYIGRAGLAGSDNRVLAATLRGPGLDSGHDERTLVAQADLGTGPRRALPTMPTLVASADTAAPVGAARASLYGQARATTPAVARGVAFVPVADANSFELAGVDPTTIRAALLASKHAPANTGITAAMAPASGGPLSILPLASNPGAVAASDDESAPSLPSRTSSYAAGERISSAHAIFRTMGDGDRLAALAD
ncbi:septal ring lytic transglycosylase RlpA family protein [Pinisolibacter sp.]|uniref:septal ring lytic transglycosylase RlpA family protein n=1 Tax=Pinisolibacter sp. TaxID=2172024 RepID=UPI002FDDCB1A